jgi:hypothetical protein
VDSAVKHITPAEAQRLALDEARKHVLAMLKEQQAWIDAGKDIQTYILIKTNLYTKSTS